MSQRDQGKGGWRTGLAGILEKGASLYDKAVKHNLDSLRYAEWNAHAWMDGNVYPAWEAGLKMQQAFRGSILDVVSGKRALRELVDETQDRLSSAWRFKRLVDTLGKAAYGSATFEGEEVLAEDSVFKLSYLPPKAGVERQDLAIFHAGGSIPYGEGVFRLTPEYNLYDRFLERGLPVYAMEVKGDAKAVAYKELTVEALVLATQRLSDVAFEHNQGRKMALEGYCGSGTQALVYLTAMPEDVERKFESLVTFVTPVDGRRCSKMAESVQRMPQAIMDANLWLWDETTGVVPGDSTRLGIDLTLGAVFYKTPMGYFTAGWMRSDFANVRTDADLTPQQRRDLAGAYWISADSARRFPIPVDISRFTTGMFSEGVDNDGTLPWTWQGRQLSLRDVADKTSIRVLGFYGGEDPVISDRTGLVMGRVFGDRYTHVLHQDAGHISYVLSPKMWRHDYKRALKPNPVDLLLARGEAS